MLGRPGDDDLRELGTLFLYPVKKLLCFVGMLLEVFIRVALKAFIGVVQQRQPPTDVLAQFGRFLIVASWRNRRERQHALGVFRFEKNRDQGLRLVLCCWAENEPVQNVSGLLSGLLNIRAWERRYLHVLGLVDIQLGRVGV